jgi:S-formylglutathione hydrolase FrmB
MPNPKLLRFILALLLLVLFARMALPQQATQRVASGRLIEIRITAPSLKGNLLGDPAEQYVTIYLPPSYDASSAKRYPTVYLLHPGGGSNKTWTNNDPARVNIPIQPALDALINGGKIREMIVVAPNGKNAYIGSFYTNSPVTGNWEDYIYRDAVAYVDSNFRTLARPSSRGIAGHSMGGFGATSIAMKHPDVFSALYALSPCCLGMEGDFDEANPAWKRVENLTSKDQLPKEPKSLDDFYTNVLVAMSAAFSPNSGRSPFYADFLYTERDGKLERNDTVYAQWKSKMPLYMVEDYKKNLLSLRGIVIDYGQKEGFSHVRIASTLFSKALAERSIPHIFEVYEGGTHTNKVKERMETRVFQFFSDKLDFSNP